jgi:hypothetical protein
MHFIYLMRCRQLRRLPVLLLTGLLLWATAAATAAPPPQTRPWRIGIAGGYCTGYLGIFALHGLPRERLHDKDLEDLQLLKQYDLIIAGWRTGSSSESVRAIEQYVREGGLALIEGVPAPSVEAIPGRRLPAAQTPNLRFLDSGTPVTAGLPAQGVIPTAGLRGAAIVPDPGSKAIIWANYTDEGTPEKLRGKFIVNGQGAPAIIMTPLGQGTLIYSGPSIAFATALRGRDFEPFIINLLRHLSQGQLADRMFPGNFPAEKLLTLPETTSEPPPYPTAPEPLAEAPAGFEPLEEATSLQDFVLTGELPARGEARVLISWANSRWGRELRCGGGKVTLQHTAGGKPVTVASAALTGGGKLMITRRAGLLTVEVGGRVLLAAGDGPPQQGLLAQQGLTDPAYQPLAPVTFRDDFMREAGYDGEWEQVAGKWQVVASEGKPEMGANPFNYQVQATDRAVTLSGHWFWTDYDYQVALQAAAQSVGLLCHYQSPQDYVALRLQRGEGASPATLQLVRQVGSSSKTLAETPVKTTAEDWQRLGVRVSRGRLIGLLDGEPLLQVNLPLTACGQIGLFCEQGSASFDDVVVNPWLATPPGEVPLPEQFATTRGTWTPAAGGKALSGFSRDGAKALSPLGDLSETAATTQVNLGGATAAGLYLRHAGDREFLLVALVAEGQGVKLRAYRHGNPGRILGEVPLPGRLDQWRTLQAEVTGNWLRATVDGKPLLSVLADGPAAGQVGLYARGVKPALFRAYRAEATEDPRRLVDELTPSFAGIIDRHTWAGRSGAWRPEPANLNRFWHHGFFPGEVTLEMGVHPDKDTAATTTRLHLSPEREAARGYGLVAERTWSADHVSLTLTREGKPVGQAKVKVTPAEPYALGLERVGPQLMVRVNQQTALVFEDRAPLPGLDTLGLDNGGALLIPDDVVVSSAGVRDYTFEAAPTDWTVESGTWKVSSRWSCTPGWAWFAGYNAAGPAMIRTKQGYQGDLEMVTYVGAKMMPAGEKRFSEKLTDIHLALCVGESSVTSGYHIIIGGNDNGWTGLQKNGQTVKMSSFRLSQSGIHNDWLQVRVARRGNRLQVWAWDTPVLDYEDPEPLPGGRLAVGTHRNGVIIPRVTLFTGTPPVGGKP